MNTVYYIIFGVLGLVLAWEIRNSIILRARLKRLERRVNDNESSPRTGR